MKSFNRKHHITACLWNAALDVSSPQSKVVHFIRHGQGYHNFIDDVAKESGATFSDVADYSIAVQEKRFYLKQALNDPPLTAVGVDDAKKLRHSAKSINPELFIVSPLKRATQTILYGFCDHLKNNPSLPVIALESCREQHGLYYSDHRSNLDDYGIDFPRVSYEHMHDIEDTLWNPTERETVEEMCNRQNDFLEFLQKRPEKEVVVGTHSAWLFSMMNILLDIQRDQEASLKPMFSTGEMRTVVLTWQN